MKAALRYLLFITLTALGYPASEDHAPTPRILQAMIGGFSGESYEIIYDGRELRYYKAATMFGLKDATPEVIKVSASDWNTFLSQMDEIKVWTWKRNYRDPKVMDGTVWNVTIVYDLQKERSVVSYGSNAYPQNFARFLQALSQLAGGRQFN